MNPAELLAHLHDLDVHIRVEGDTLMLGPADRIPPDLLEAVRAVKPELLAMLSARALAAWSEDAPSSPVSALLADPRADLVEDTVAWGQLLYLAQGVDAEFAATLNGFRCCGARLGHRNGSWRIYPLLDPTERLSIWQSREAYVRDSEKWLLPFRSALTSLLGMLPVPDSTSIQPQSAAQKES